MRRLSTPNRSRHLPSLLHAYGDAARNSRRRKLCDEALAAIEPLFRSPASPQAEADSQTNPILAEARAELTNSNVGVSQADLEPLRELLVTLKYLDRGWRSAKSSATRAKLQRAYAVCLQAWLSSNDLQWPKDLFVPDLQTPGSGPRARDIGMKAAALYRPRTFGWRRVARQLIADGDLDRSYLRDLPSAEKEVAKLAKPWLIKPTHPLSKHWIFHNL